MASDHEKSTQAFCLRWNHFQSNLLNVFDRLFQDEQFVDVTLACDGHLIKAHKMVLSASSTYFQQIFTLHPCPHPVIIMKDVPLAELKQVLEFIYRGEVNVQKCDIPALLVVAKALKIRGLAQAESGEPHQPSTSKLCAKQKPNKRKRDRSLKRTHHQEASTKSLDFMDEEDTEMKRQNTTEHTKRTNEEDFIDGNNTNEETTDVQPILIGSVRSIKSELNDEMFEEYPNLDDAVSCCLSNIFCYD